MWHPANDHVNKPLALGICADCPVRQQCLEHALERREPLAIWGGKTVWQRTAMLTR